MNNEENRIKVLLVDDHAVVREGYKNLLDNYPEIEVVAEAESGEIACKFYVDYKPDIVIMDLSLPGIGGLEAIRRITARDPKAKILVFSMHEDTVFVEQALQAGARGYISKSSAANDLVEAVQEIASGNDHLDPEIAQRLAIQKSRGAIHHSPIFPPVNLKYSVCWQKEQTWLQSRSVFRSAIRQLPITAHR